MPSVVNASPLIFSPFFCSLFFCPIVDLSQCEMETSFSGLLGLLPAYLRLLEVFVEHLYSFFSFLKIFQLVACKGFWSIIIIIIIIYSFIVRFLTC